MDLLGELLFSPQKCRFLLPCGHRCYQNDTVLCETLDPDHLHYICTKQCNKKKMGCQQVQGLHHPCKKLCFEPCEPCRESVLMMLKCGHATQRICSDNLKNIKCTAICEKKLHGCTRDHICRKLCSEPCSTEPCSIEWKKTLPCGHTRMLKCHVDPGSVQCLEMCSRASPLLKKCSFLLRCGHVCRNADGHWCATNDAMHVNYKCMEVCRKPLKGCQQKDGALHRCTKFCHELCDPFCLVTVTTKFPCGHKASTRCSTFVASTLKCKKPCKKPAVGCSRDHKCQKLCSEPCSKEPCNIEWKKTLSCGHTRMLQCHIDPKTALCLMETCKTVGASRRTAAWGQVPCSFLLPCGHNCAELDSRWCSSYDPGHTKYKCPQKCTKPNKGCVQKKGAQHLCQKLCHEPCDPCLANVKTAFPCGHSVNRPCNISQRAIKCTTPCSKKPLGCTRDHTCTHPCSEPCSKKLCTIRWKKKLPCGHGKMLKCHINPQTVQCNEVCNKMQGCGHKCPLSCSVKCGPCSVRVAVTLRCGHQGKYFCGQIPSGNLRDLQSRTCTECRDNPLMQSCHFVLDCGHKCIGGLGCPLIGTNHKGYKCHLPCRRIAAGCSAEGQKHLCQNKCFESCSPCSLLCQKMLKCGHLKTVPCSVDPLSTWWALPCGHATWCQQCRGCSIVVRKKFSNCDHVLEYKCSGTSGEKETMAVSCTEMCERELPCRHACTKLCIDPCGPCFVNQRFKLECGHEQNGFCCDLRKNGDKTGMVCDTCAGERDVKDCVRAQDCNTTLPCGHNCDKKQCALNALHLKYKCDQPCNRIKTRCSTGQHKCIKKCHEPCDTCFAFVEKKASCGHHHYVPCCNDVSVVRCNENCPRSLPCGHPCPKKCFEDCGTSFCLEQKSVRFSCGHFAIKFCGEDTVDTESRCHSCQLSHFDGEVTAINDSHVYVSTPESKILKFGLTSVQVFLHGLKLSNGLDVHLNSMFCPGMDVQVRYVVPKPEIHVGTLNWSALCFPELLDCWLKDHPGVHQNIKTSLWEAVALKMSEAIEELDAQQAVIDKNEEFLKTKRDDLQLQRNVLENWSPIILD